MSHSTLERIAAQWPPYEQATRPGDRALEIVNTYSSEVEEDFFLESLEGEFPTFVRQLGLRACDLAAFDNNTAGTFKWMSATVGMALNRSDSERFIVPSAGNFARGATVAAKALDKSVTLVVPHSAPQDKKEGIKQLWHDGRVTILPHGDTFDESLLHAQKLAAAGEGTLLHPFDDPNVIAGGGVEADRILSIAPDTDNIVVATGGNGQLAGVVSRLSELGRSDVNVYAVEAEGSDSLSRSLSSGKLVEATSPNARFGGSAVRTCGQVGLKLLTQAGYSADNIVTASDEQVLSLAENYLQDRKDQMVEGASAYEPTTLVAVAGLIELQRRGLLKGRTVVSGSGRNAPVADVFGRPSPHLRTHIANGLVLR